MKSTIRIALVDDDVNLLFLLEHTLKKAFTGAEFYTFEDGAIALAYILQHPIDLIITDNQMPRMDGSELTRELRAQGWGLPIIMLSGSPDAEEKGMAAGITKFISKAPPTMAAELIQSTCELLSLQPSPEAESLLRPTPSHHPKSKKL